MIDIDAYIDSIENISFISSKQYPIYEECLNDININNAKISRNFCVIVGNNVDWRASANISEEFHQILAVMNKDDIQRAYFSTQNDVQNWMNYFIQPGLETINNQQLERVKKDGKIRLIAKFDCCKIWYSNTCFVFVDVPSHIRLTNIEQVRPYINHRQLDRNKQCNGCKKYARHSWWDIFDSTNPNHRTGGTHQTQNCSGCKNGICDILPANTLHVARFGKAVEMMQLLHSNFNISLRNVNGQTMIYLQ
eukprot:396564_1